MRPRAQGSLKLEQDNMAFTKEFYTARAMALASKSTIDRGLEKKIMALKWIYRWGYSFPSLLDQVGNVCSRGLSAKMVKQGLLKSTKTASAGGFKDVPSQMLTLTVEGLRVVENHIELQYGYETDPYRIKQDQLRHYFICQSLTMKAINENKIESFLTEKEYVVFSKNGVKQPDAIWVTFEGTKLGIEIELTGKWDRKLHQFVKSCILAIQVDDEEVTFLNYIVIYAESDALIDRYKKAFHSGQKHPIWIKDGRGYWQQDGEFSVPNGVKGKIICKKY